MNFLFNSLIVLYHHVKREKGFDFDFFSQMQKHNHVFHVFAYLLKGRNLLQDMMLVLHLEMELRRRAIDRFSSENNDAERARHMSEVLAIQEQMQEITGFLNILFSIPPNQQAARRYSFSTLYSLSCR